jgi:hypothetical protein
MKKHVIVFAMMLVVIVTTILSCNRPEIPPINAASCPQIFLNSVAGSDSQTVFMNSPITSITYGITLDAAGDSTGFTASALPLGVTGYYSGGIFTIEGTPITTVGSPFTYTVSAIGSACQGISMVTGRIVVDSCATINLTSAAGTDSQTVAVNHALINITYSTTGTSTVTVSSLPVGVTETFSGATLTISGTPTTTTGSPFTYTLIPSSNNCAAPVTGLITVTP